MRDYASITRKGSKTFYTASLFFPPHVRADVHKLYAYVRTVDDLIDSTPPKLIRYKTFKSDTLKALETNTSSDYLISGLIDVVKTYAIPTKWLQSFYTSQEMDLTHRRYETFSDLKKYTYGVAEVIGLMMAKIMRLTPRAYKPAQLLGQSMQYLNIIRDVHEDLQMDRIYMPQSDMRKFSVTDQDLKHQRHPKRIIALLRYQIKRFIQIHSRAREGLHQIRRRYRVPIQASYELYAHVAQQIYNDPLVVFSRKVKPRKPLIMQKIVQSYWDIYTNKAS